MMFKRYTLYTHNRMLDSAILVLRCVPIEGGRYALKIRWANRRGFDLNITESIIIKAEEVANWYEL